ncbi:hypothetical protein O3M35_010401 [Rhynocoris fuscipes]|uniref:Uncharacterized protein n=1 Tax=Rhynocoris fuscipes TaxID=488301 RepID=A0AAW1CZR1_9HEMI
MKCTVLFLFAILVTEMVIVSTESITLDEESRKKKIGGKKGQNLLPIILIPFLIQAKILPLMLLHMKLVATKALLMGKLAILLLALNVVRNIILGTDYIDEQYEMETLATKHYGYNGGPEFGAWVNRRKRRVRKRDIRRRYPQLLYY